ncbi:MAG: TIGR00725 family protein [Chloroflexota bacterium]
MSIVIAVIGRSECPEDDTRTAEAVGRLVAQKGAVLVCGGLTGVMEAACRGAREANGFTVGILPGNDRRDANPWVSLPIATGVGQARNISVVRSSDAVIAVGGAYGTLSEIAFALNSAIPVVGIGSWRVSERGAGPNPVYEAASPEEAVEIAFRLVSVKKEDSR